MQENSFKFFIINYWRSIDKKILFCFFVLFFLGLFFSFSSTSSLAGERLNKDYYFFFTKHFFYTLLALTIMLFISIIKTKTLIKFTIPKTNDGLFNNKKNIDLNIEKKITNKE